MPDVSILILGDLIIDETWYVEVTRLNPEAPVPTAELTGVQPYREPGGAGFAAAWAASQGLKVSFISAVAEQNTPRLSKYGINVYSPWDNCDLNVTKTRYIDRNSGYHLMRLDNDRLVARPNTSPGSVIEIMEQIIKCNRIDVCLISDYCKGFFHDNVPWKEVLLWLQTNRIPTILDTRARYTTAWTGSDASIPYAWTKLNDRELKRILKSLNWNLDDNGESIIRNKIFSRLLVTHGKDGAHAYEAIQSEILDSKEKPNVCVYGYAADTDPRLTPDPTGCGDIFDVAFISSIGAGKSTRDALEYAVKTATKFAYIPLKDKFNG